MQKLLSVFIFLAFALTAHAQRAQLDNLFDQYEGAKGITTIKIAKPMFRMLNNLKIEDADIEKIKPLLNKINAIRIMIVDPQAAAGTASASIAQTINSTLKNMHYQELMTVTSDDNKIKFLAQNVTDSVLDHLLLSILGKDQQVLMMLDGSVSMDDISSLANQK